MPPAIIIIVFGISLGLLAGLIVDMYKRVLKMMNER